MFTYRESIVSLTIPEGIVEIGEKAFEKCSELTTINIPDSVTRIRFGAFLSCSRLKEITIPNSIKTIEAGTFMSCFLLEKVIIPNSVIKIEKAAFSYCWSLKIIALPNSVVEISEKAFYKCEDLEKIDIPQSIIKIGYKAFGKCAKLNNVTFHGDNKYIDIETDIFGDCESLTIYAYSGGKTEEYAKEYSIPFVSISEKTSKKKGSLSQSKKDIIDAKEADCDNPIEIIMSDGSKKIFDYCDEFAVSAQKVYIVVRQKVFSNGYLFFVFRNINGEKKFISSGQDQISVYLQFIEKYRNDYEFTDERIVKKKPKHFAQDTALKLFRSSNELPQILTIPGKYNIISSNVFEKLHLNGKEIRQIIIPESVEVIEENAFAGLIVTEAVFISSKVRKIGENAFTLKEGAYIFCKEKSKAFSHFSRKTDFTLVKDISFLGWYRHSEINEINNDLSNEKEATRIKKNTFEFTMHIPEIDEIFVPNCIHIIEDEAFRYAKIKKRIIIPSSVAMIGKNAFELMPDAYVECDKKSFAYLYCKENGIRNSVDISYYKSKGLCPYCGGKFEGLFKKKCCQCGKTKDY